MAWTKQNIFPARELAADGSACVMKLLDKEFLRDAVKARGGYDRTSAPLDLPHMLNLEASDIYNLWRTNSWWVDADYTPSTLWDVSDPWSSIPWTKTEAAGLRAASAGAPSTNPDAVRRLFHDIREMRRAKWRESYAQESLTYTKSNWEWEAQSYQVYGYFYDKDVGDHGSITATGGNLLLPSSAPFSVSSPVVAFVAFAIVSTGRGQDDFVVPMDVSSGTIPAASIMAAVRSGMNHYGISERTSGVSQSIMAYYGSALCLGFLDDPTDISDLGWNWEPGA